MNELKQLGKDLLQNGTVKVIIGYAEGTTPNRAKPFIARTPEDAEKLVKLVEKTGLIFAVTHTYTGYPMVKEARKMVQEGELGKIRKIVVEYPQGWLTTPLEKTDHVQASWRTDPSKTDFAEGLIV